MYYEKWCDERCCSFSKTFSLLLFVGLLSLFSMLGVAVVIYPQEYTSALRNSLMGFRYDTNSSNYQQPYVAVTRCYIKWNEIENDESDTIDKIKTFCNTKWAGMENYNVKVIPRVYLDWDSASGNEYWPADMTAGDYTSEQFKTRLRRLIQRLGQCWNNDPRVAWIQMGIIGYWGEQETPWPTAEIQQLMGDEFAAAFPNKKVLVRRPKDAFTAYPFGGYLDSWANWDKENTDGAAADYLNTTQARWKVNVWEGESAYNCCGYQTQPGDSPDDTMKDPVHRNFMIDTIRKRHCSALGWVSGYTKSDPDAVAGAEEVQRAFGYRYLLNEVTYPGTLTPGAEFSVEFKVKNVGSAPFHYNWPVEISLLDKTTKALVWHDTFDGCNIRNWLPGDQYNGTTRVYDVPAVVNTVSGTFRLPTGIANGEYILALAILDPDGMLPSARFATVNYFNGGRHPIGYTGVNVTPSQYPLSPGLFNDPASDSSLYYSLTGAPMNGVSVIQAENYSAMSGVGTETCLDTGGGLDLNGINNGNWAEYIIKIPSAGTYPVDFRVASATTGGTINMVVGGSTVGSVAVTGTGGSQNWTTVSTTATFSAAGSQTLRLNFVGGSGYLYTINWFKVIFDTTTPAIPTGLAATASQGLVSLDWADNSETDLWVYGVYRAQTSGGPYTHVQDVFTSDWVDYGVTGGTTYYYVVSAVDTGSNESANSSQVSATLQEPAAPTGLAATAGNGSVSLNWADNTEPDLASYNVKRATVTGGPYTTIATDVAVSAYTDNTVTNGTTYYYVVSAVDTGSNESVNSSQVSATPQVPQPPTFVAAGAVASGTGTITPALPSGIASGDILLLFLETSNQAISISNQNGGTWTEVTNSPQYCGTAAGTTGARLTAFWSRYNGTQGAPTASDSGNHQLGRMIAIRGAAASGNPWDVTAGGVEATSDTSGSIPGATTTVADTLVVTAIATSLPDASSTSKFSGWTNANLTSLTERTDNSVNAGNGGGLGIATGVKATAGAYGNTAVTLADSAYKGMISIAIKN